MNNQMKANAKISYAYSLGTNKVNSICETNTIDIEIRYVDLKIKKTASDYYYKPGDQLNYSIVISNTGNYIAEDVIVVDDINNLTFLEGSSSILRGNNTAQVLIPNIDEDNITFEIGHIDPQTSVIINYSAMANPEIANDEDLTNTATIYAKRLSPIYSNVISIEQKYANIISRKTASKDYVYNYDYLDFNIKLTNTGNTPASNVVISEVLPKGFVLLDENETVTIDGEPYVDFIFDPATNAITITLDELNNGDDETNVIIRGRIIINK